MSKTVDTLVVLKGAKWKHWRDTIYWLLFTVFGSGLPIYGGWFLLNLWSREVKFTDFCQDGQFALYSAAILGATLHLISRGGYKDIFVHMRLFSLICSVFLIFATLIFCGSMVTNTQASGDSPTVNIRLLVFSSTILLILTLGVAFLANLIDISKADMDPRGIGNDTRKKLNDEFDAIGEE